MTSPHESEDWLSADSVRPRPAGVRRVDGQGDEVPYATLLDAMCEDPRAGDLDLRLVDERDRTLAEVDGRCIIRVGSVRTGYRVFCWRDEVATVQRKVGEASVVERVVPEWRFTVAGEERLALENDQRRTREMAGAA